MGRPLERADGPKDAVEQIVRAVLYEGYLLWPYRASALKNRQRWTLGGVYPEPYGRARGGDDPWLAQTQCLMEADLRDTLDVRIRFLQLVLCEIDGGVREEATEREVAAPGLRLADLVGHPHRLEIDIPPGRDEARSWHALRGDAEVGAEQVRPGVFRVTVTLTNTTDWRGEARQEAQRRAFVSAHIVLIAGGPGFVSQMDPPDEFRALAEECRNIGVWPVLVGEEGERHTMLASPIIIYDHPKIAPESPGDLYDATEIDQLLRLSVLSLSDEERQEIRAGDPRGREILDLCEGLSPDQLMLLHGALRDVRGVTT